MARKDLDNCKACGTQDCILVFFHNTRKNNSIKIFTPNYFNELDTTGDKVVVLPFGGFLFELWVEKRL